MVEPDPRLGRLLDAVTAVTSDLSLEAVLHRVVEAACTLVDARYGALGVIDDDRQGLRAFVHHGIDAREAARIGTLPEGRGLLGVLVREPQALRLEDLATHPEALGLPPGHPPMRSFLGVPVTVRGRVWGNLYLTEKQGGAPFSADDERLVIGLASVAGSAIANARLYEQSRLRGAWRRAVVEVATTIVAGADPLEVRRRIADLARDLVEADGAVVIDVAGGDAIVLASSGTGVPAVGQALGPERCATFAALRPGGVTFDASGDAETAGAVCWAPIALDGAVVAVLGVRRSRPTGERQRDALVGFAEQLAFAWTFERARQDLKRLSIVEERERIGRDLHDTVIQELFATGLSLQSAMRLLPEGSAATARLEVAVDAIDATIKGIRLTIFALQSDDEERRGLRARVLALVDEVGALLPVVPRVRIEGPVDTVVPAAVADQVLPVLREALTNVLKHAQATAVEVVLASLEGSLELTVRDDGRGLPAERPGPGLGLMNLLERARALGGESLVASGPDGRGTVVVWRVPL
jgi:signal transduction histidine kinase